MIKRVKWKNYKALGNLELDFTKSDGSSYNTIVLAGENGSGKTTILDSLSDFLNGQSIIPFDYIEYNVNNSNYVIRPSESIENARIGFHSRLEAKSNVEKLVTNGNKINIDNDIEDLRHYGFAYSKARSGFKTNAVRSITTQQIDDEKFEPDAQEDFTRIKQLLVDIDSQDSNEWMRQSNNLGLSDKKFEDFKKQSKQYRFEKAFSSFFDDVRYKGINDDNPKEKNIIFEKHNQQITVDDLSTGEKQIVFRGAHLLRNINSIKGGIVLIDEPELSMHPVWQKKILGYYRNLFTSEGIQNVQMIIATHSEYVVRSALEDRSNVLVIVLSDNKGIINSSKISAPNVLPVITAAETNYLAFKVPSIDYHIELYGYLQTKINNHSVAACDQYIVSQTAFYDPSKHEKNDSFQSHQYKTLPTYIRNAIDHPDSGRTFTEEELKTSIELLVNLCK